MAGRYVVRGEAASGDAAHAAAGSSGCGGRREQSGQSLSLSASSTLSGMRITKARPHRAQMGVSLISGDSGYSITWSARSSNDGGIVRPSAFAVFRLITHANLVGLLDLQVGRVYPFQDLVDKHGGTSVKVFIVRPIGQETAGLHQLAVTNHYWQAVL